MLGTFLITGGAGFIGRHLARELLAHGHRVRILDALVQQVHGDGLPDLPEGVEFIQADLRDMAAVSRALEGVDGVYHLAAEVGVGQSMYEIERYVSGNDVGTAVLLQAMIDKPVRRIVVASSMSVYGEGVYVDSTGLTHDRVRRDGGRMKQGQWNPVNPLGSELTPVPTAEEKPVDLASIYALTKYAQEQAVLIFGRAYGVEAVALRLFNVFGPGQALSNPYTGVLANFASRLANGQAPMIFEDGRQRRDFVHVRDVACAFRLAMERPGIAGHLFNIGSGRSYAIADVARMLADAMGAGLILPDILGRARSGDIRHCFADISRAREMLGYQPRYLLEDSLYEMAGWVAQMEAHDRGSEMRRQLEQRGLVS
ncbi:MULTISPECIES: NAD(P)-dependent oxidoreductase [unclassified Azospirillum]|uniref:NAD-dependent epimerase/dehydratase family protein n=1 Tax=unclassified Azospirillum TaxID=2630922 RepID=UPI000B716EE9|nr:MULTISPECIES: NAD-dependent epimerase/dehydratase family protein [unclassified Azospirillum]SNS10856.1 dTDP-L-rhamnose 4-epimerase [Azospirillum sp. RU38E]SNS27535.1 dTDP-L-rhamnose 4-epimerase [Azospirillum sp. RU37A]